MVALDVPLISLDIIIPTVRANASGLRRAVELPVPPHFAGLRLLIVVDGPQSEAAWDELKTLAAAHEHVVLLVTTPSQHGWPAGAGAARNTGIAATAADWVLFLDDDTTPEIDLLYRYAEAMVARLALDGAEGVFGFAGVTSFLARGSSLWAVAAQSSGMIDAFTYAMRREHPPWSPTANLMLRRVAPSAAAADRAGTKSMTTTTEAVQTTDDEDDGEVATEAARLLPSGSSAPNGGGGVSAAAANAESAVDGEAATPLASSAARLAWCHFDESLPRNGGAEDVDICVRATVYRPGQPSNALPVVPVVPRNALEHASAEWLTPCAQQRLVGVPLAVTTHVLWSARGMLARGLRWGYAGSQIAHKFPQLARWRPMSTVESLLLGMPLVAVLTCVTLPVAGRPWRAVLLVVAIRLLGDMFGRVCALPWRVRHNRYFPEHMRLRLDEPALFAWCGERLWARWVGLALLHAGPVLCLSLAFQLGETYGKLEPAAPCLAKLRLLGRSWDFSMGDEEPPPAKLTYSIHRRMQAEIATAMLLALLLEASLCGQVGPWMAAAANKCSTWFFP